MTELLRRTTFEATNGHQLAIVTLPIIMASLATVTVVFRFRSRRIQKQKYMFDDWLALAALVLTWTFQGVNMAAVFAGGAGLPITTVMAVDPQALYTYLKIVVANFSLWIFTVTVVQLSILSFYLRIFGVHKIFTWACYITIFLVVGMGIAGFCLAIFSCNPISVLWDPTVQGTCIDSTKSCSAVGIIHVLLDLAIVVMPMPLIWNLKIAFSSKVVLSCLLGLGLVATVISLIKIDCVFDLTGIPSSDVTDYLWLTILLQTLELPIGIICCCVPSLKPVVVELAPTLRSFTTRLLSLTRQSGGSSSRIADESWPRANSENESTPRFVPVDSSFNNVKGQNLGHTVDARGNSVELSEQPKFGENRGRGIAVSNTYNVRQE
ncbi:hypothetical protein PFICI_09664 [Pestalotiopsis fici W106-1]|uniref:Rhodopsin domain-containing protein n=1 Tax=Pestalotiopsis fici (strain W106-1 / CGMCC3.15140) TaxID=1229662 RepID=W3WWU2_PESFW|nr:uncharacterized protein PFICI_09664 [Pestalotiopsis fici W106-1]ETS77602.1 hypothetical protein PFICI_09664 [Pestalotiopsis fici W106-1]